MQALEEGRRLEKQDLYLHELPLAQLASLYANSKRDPKKSNTFKLSDFTLFASDADKEVSIPSSAANAFFSLLNDNKLPEWVLSIVPIDKLRAVKNDAVVRRPRCLIGDNVLLLIPNIDDDEILFQLGIFDNAHGEINLIDVDTGRTFKTFIPTRNRSWVLEGSIPLNIE